MRPREDDHFWRRKVVNRIDLQEKINQPLTKRESSYYIEEPGEEAQYPQKNGLVMALFDGLKKGQFLAYKQDSLGSPMTYDEVVAKIKKFEGDEGGDDFDDGFGGDDGFDDFEGDDLDGDDFSDGDGWFGDEEGEGGDDDLEGDNSGYAGDFDPGPYENVIQFVEDRIFDKVRSDMVYDIQFVEIIWTDPGESLPEKYLCTFKYKDIIKQLGDAQWKNRFNDAEYRTLREIFELRLFHSFITEVSGVGVNSLAESEKRRKRIVEFEHNLWSY